LSLGVTNQAIYYRDAFRKTDEFAAIIEVAPHGRLIDASDRLLSACHLDRASALGRPLDRLFSPATAARLIGVGRAAVANDNTGAELSTAPSTRFLDRRMFALALSPNLAFLRAIDTPPADHPRRDALLNEVSALSDGLIYIYDVDRQRTSFMNSNMSRLLGSKPGASVPLARIMALVHPADAEDVMHHVEDFSTLADGRVIRHSFRLLRRSDDTWRRIENRYAVLSRNASGTVQCVIGCAFDITDRDLSAERTANAEVRFEVEEVERRRIARELHDSTAQHLVAADLMVGAHLRENGAKSDDVLASARATLGQALREIRTLSFLLHPPGRQTAGFAKMLRGFAEGFAQRSDLLLSIDIDAPDEPLPPAAELILFRICQEAFMNVRRHANATSVALRFHLRGGDAILEVEDNGVGIADETNLGVGIESMRTRLQEIGGSLTIENTGNGTLVRACAPRNMVN
jgi:signal transduction histidine kinase